MSNPDVPGTHSLCQPSMIWNPRRLSKHFIFWDTHKKQLMRFGDWYDISRKKSLRKVLESQCNCCHCHCGWDKDYSSEGDEVTELWTFISRLISLSVSHNAGCHARICTHSWMFSWRMKNGLRYAVCTESVKRQKRRRSAKCSSLEKKFWSGNTCNFQLTS